MTFKFKLIAAQTPLFIALVLLSAVSLFSVTSLGSKSQEILKDNYRSVLAAQRIKESVERLDDAVFLQLNARGVKDLPASTKPLMDNIERELQMQEGNITEPGETEATKALRKSWEEVKSLVGKLENTPGEKAGALYVSAFTPALKAVRVHSDEILGINQDSIVRKSNRAKAFSDRLRALVLAGAVAAALFALYVTSVLTKRAVRPLQVLQQAVKRLGEGDMEARAAIKGKDEIARLAEDFNAMAENLHQYKKSSLGDLLRAQQAAQAAIDSLPDPVIILGTKGEVISINRSAEDFLGSANQISDFEPGVRAALTRLQELVVRGNGPYVPHGLDEAVRVVSREGERYLLPGASPLHDEDGLTIGVTAVLKDITRFKRFDELKDDMVSTVAHEFRTPLTSMRMAIHLCLEETVGPLNEKQAELLGAAREDCERLQILVDDLLDLSRMEKDSAQTLLEPASASGLLHQATARHRDEAKDGSVTLKQQLFGADPVVLADPNKIAIVLDNLVSNAIRYSPPGGEVELRAAGEKGVVRFAVADNGPGIPEKYRQKLFDKRFQIPGVEGGATGLGLAIAREIVLSHGGEIGVESEAGRGSVFWFTLREAVERAPDKGSKRLDNNSP